MDTCDGLFRNSEGDLEMKVYKKNWLNLLLFLFVCSAFVFLIRIISIYSVKESPILQGTYICDKLPFASMVFDLNDNYTFYYYNYNEEDKGIYSKGTAEEHFINSSKFHNTKILYNRKKQTFEIIIDGETFLFKQMSGLPIINFETD